jgi:hypothetical protein
MLLFIAVSAERMLRRPAVTATPPVAAPAPIAAAPATPTVATRPRDVTLRFLVHPPAAHYQIWVDGTKLDQPQVEVPPSGERALTVKVLADGYQTLELRPLPVTDLAIPVNLVKRPAPPRDRIDPARLPAAPRSDDKAARRPAPKDPRVKRIEDL